MAINSNAPQPSGGQAIGSADAASSLWWQRALRRLDDALMQSSSWFASKQSTLSILMFHGVFLNKAEAFNGDIDPYQPITLDEVESLIAFFLKAGAEFVSPATMSEALEPGRHRIMLTFDDGYANNLRLLPVLRRHNVPATLFVTSHNIEVGDVFWWDAQYRERMAIDSDPSEIEQERRLLKGMRNSEIWDYLKRKFGSDVLRSRGETDRPMTIAELQSLASDPLITIGNHSHQHQLLDRVPVEEAREQVRIAQAKISEWTGSAPQVIAYPNGIYNSDIVQIARDEGFANGLIALPGRVQLPLDKEHQMVLPRFAPSGMTDLDRFARIVTAPVSLSRINKLRHARRQQFTQP